MSEAYTKERCRCMRKNREPKYCQVCGQTKGAGLHFGVITCAGCKRFYMRMRLKPLDGIPCKRGKRMCDVTGDNRAACVFCRYKKCLQLGMKVTNRKPFKMQAKPSQNEASDLNGVEEVDIHNNNLQFNNLKEAINGSFTSLDKFNIEIDLSDNLFLHSGNDDKNFSESHVFLEENSFHLSSPTYPTLEQSCDPSLVNRSDHLQEDSEDFFAQFKTSPYLNKDSVSTPPPQFISDTEFTTSSYNLYNMDVKRSVSLSSHSYGSEINKVSYHQEAGGKPWELSSESKKHKAVFERVCMSPNFSRQTEINNSYLCRLVLEYSTVIYDRWVESVAPIMADLIECKNSNNVEEFYKKAAILKIEHAWALKDMPVVQQPTSWTYFDFDKLYSRCSGMQVFLNLYELQAMRGRTFFELPALFSSDSDKEAAVDYVGWINRYASKNARFSLLASRNVRSLLLMFAFLASISRTKYRDVALIDAAMGRAFQLVVTSLRSSYQQWIGMSNVRSSEELLPVLLKMTRDASMSLLAVQKKIHFGW